MALVKTGTRMLAAFLISVDLRISNSVFIKSDAVTLNIVDSTISTLAMLFF